MLRQRALRDDAYMEAGPTGIWDAGTMKRIAPIFAVRDVAAAMTFYERLGFAVRRFPGAEYGFATRGDVEIHLGLARPGLEGTSAAYLFVDDADRLAALWRTAGAEVHPPEDTEWGQREGALVDPDGNIIRFGSPLI